MLEIQFEEEYILLTAGADITGDAIINEVDGAVETYIDDKNRNFIVLLAGITSATSVMAAEFLPVQQKIQQKGGILVIAAAPDELQEALADSSIISVPTLDEAIDYVFMEEIEKKFWDEDENGHNEENR